MRNVVQLGLAANNILHICKGNRAFSFLRALLRENGRSLRFPRIFIKNNKLGDRMIKQLLNSVIANIVICQCLADQLFASAFGFGKYIIDLLATDKSRYFAEPRPIIVVSIVLECNVD